MQIGMARVALDEKQFSNFASPVPDTGSNLFTFLAARLSASFQNLGCGALLNAPNPVKLTLDGNGVATAASFSPLAIGTLPGGVEPSAQRPRPRLPRLRVPRTPTGTATATPTPTATGTQGGGQASTGAQGAMSTQGSHHPASTSAEGGTRGWHQPDRPTRTTYNTGPPGLSSPAGPGTSRRHTS